MTFNAYLTDIYLHTQNPTRDGFDDWLADRGVDEVIEWAEKWGSNLVLDNGLEKQNYINKMFKGSTPDDFQKIVDETFGTPNASNKPRIAEAFKAMSDAGEI